MKERMKVFKLTTKQRSFALYRRISLSFNSLLTITASNLKPRRNVHFTGIINFASYRSAIARKDAYWNIKLPNPEVKFS